jgi:tetratricopeptide (TPR) repeat protein
MATERIDKTVFISYRRTNISWALAIFQNLHQNGYDVFFDYNGIGSGDFEQVILGNITSRAHFLVLLTPSALEKCDEPEDWLRREIETALESKRNIVPLMLDAFDFGAPKISSQLTGKLAALKRYNGMSVPPEYFEAAMDRLRMQFLNKNPGAVLHPPSIPAQEGATAQRIAAEAAPAVEKEELTAEQWFEQAYAATEPAEQIRLYTEALRLKPDFATAFYNRGIAHRRLRDQDAAIRDSTEAIRLMPSRADAFMSRGIARWIQRDLDGAIRDYDETIRLKPDDATAFNNRGVARRSKGDLDGAIQDCDEAIRLKPDYATAFQNRALARQAKGDAEGAKLDLAEAARLDPKFKRQ